MEQREFDFGEIDRKSVPGLWTPDEIFNEVNQDTFGQFYEDHRFERKTAGSHADLLATYVCMWANTPPDGGIIAVGIEDDGTITGCLAKEAHVLNSERRVQNDLVPDASFATKRVLAINNKGETDFVLLYRVQYRDNKVVETNLHESFIRRVDTRHALTEDEKRELRMERGQLSYELEPCGLKWPEQFDDAAIRDWASAVQRLKGLESRPAIPQALVTHRLGKMVKGDFVPNNACALLFARDPQDVVPGCMIRFQRIEGLEAATGKERNVVQDKQITGPVPDLIEQIGQILGTHLRTYSKLGKSGKFYTAPEYPEEAWHEAVVNACAHRSYSLKGANIFVKMFDDRLVVESPGGFPPLVNPENIYEVHHRRNWWLMDALFFLEYVKCENEGAKRIRRAMEEAELPAPEFEQKQIGGAIVRVTLRNNQHIRQTWVDEDVSFLIGVDLAKELTDLERRVVNWAKDHDYKIKSTDAMKLMPRPRWGTAKSMMERLVAKGIFRFVSRYAHDPLACYELYINRPAPSASPEE